MAEYKRVKFREMLRTGRLASTDDGLLGNLRYYGLTGERREAARHQFRLRLVVNIVGGVFLVMIILVASLVGGVLGAQLMLGAYALSIIAVSVLGIYTFRKRQGQWQLWLRERKAIQQSKAKNAQDLQNYLDEMKRKGRAQ